MEESQGFILPATISIEHRETLYIKLGMGNIGVLCIFMSRTFKQTQLEGKQQLWYNVSSRKLHVVLVVLAYN